MSDSRSTRFCTSGILHGGFSRIASFLSFYGERGIRPNSIVKVLLTVVTFFGGQEEKCGEPSSLTVKLMVGGHSR